MLERKYAEETVEQALDAYAIPPEVRAKIIGPFLGPTRNPITSSKQLAKEVCDIIYDGIEQMKSVRRIVRVYDNDFDEPEGHLEDADTGERIVLLCEDIE